MRDRAWAEAALAEAGITLERVGEMEFELAIRETLDRETDRSSTSAGSPSLTSLGSLLSENDSQPSAGPAPARTAPLLPKPGSDEYRLAFTRAAGDVTCAECADARFVRDPAYVPGQKALPVHGAAPATFPGTMPCPSCNVAAHGWLLARSRVPEMLHGLTFETFEPRLGKVEALAAVLRWSTDGGGLLLHGAPGRGKTHLAIAAVLAACEVGSRAEFWPFQDLLREMQLRFDAEDDSAQALEARVRAVEVLVLDDVGAEHSRSAWATEVLESLIDHRLARSLPTLMTTNLTPTELPRRVGARSADRLQMYRWVECGGESMRAVLGRRMAEVGA
jgi:DNA replication protein DnaC